VPPKPKPTALRVELEDVSPLIWRRLVVSDQWTLAHEFQIGQRLVAPDWWIQEVGTEDAARTYEDERRVSVAAVVRDVGVGGSFEYRYDMGDGWQHRIVVESSPPAWIRYELRMPACTAGENACPPEDVGGPHGYHHFLASMRDTKSEEHGDMLRWVGGVFDPVGFDLNRVNRDWRGGRRSQR
jgi:hypothetical protein